MSFAVMFIGKSDAIKRALDRQSAAMSGQSKEEFDTVLPSLKTILDQNVNNGVIRLDANGHASFNDADDLHLKTYGNCNVTVTVLGHVAVE